MLYPGFLGPSNPTQSPYADAERLMNLYLEPVQSPGAPTPGILLPSPGFEPFSIAGAVNTRALVQVSEDLCFAVVGKGFGQVLATGTVTGIGNVLQDSNPATISYNGIVGGQLFITSGGNGYLYDLTSHVFSTVLTGEATMGGMVDGRFLAFNVVNGKVRMSDLNDGSTWDPLLFFQRSMQPDPWQAMVIDDSLIRMIGNLTSETWYNAGTSPQPFAPIRSSVMQAGTAAPFSVALTPSGLVMLNHDPYGSASIVRVEGYTPSPISNYAVSTALSGFDREGTLDDCETLVYQEQGHTFACFNFASARSTWVVDLSTGLWHERGEWDSRSSSFNVWAPRVHCHAFGRHLVGSRTDGIIAEMDVTIGTERTGGPIRRVRVPPPLWAPVMDDVSVDRLTLQLETGLGVLSGQGADPIVSLRVSKDARTFGPLRRAQAGKMGAYPTRVFWTRCGSSSKVWMPEITMSDPIPWRISGCDVYGTGFARQAA